MADDPPRLRGIRGATTVPEDTPEHICARTIELLDAVRERNRLRDDDIVSVVFTATSDLAAEFPAVAARRTGLSGTPLLCCREMDVPGSMPRCIRVLLHAYLPPGGAARHVYLHEARGLRDDLPE
jgi:chorismate mutase